ncbi:MAG: TetR/AcrR family transcriptional regulator [Opitutales bacterium]
MKVANTQTVAAKTRYRILRATEAIFAKKGFRAMTLRNVTDEAGVNLAAVNYHFGSKINLMRAVIERRFEPINRLRLQRLDAAIEAGRPHPLPLKIIFEAYFQPLFDQVGTARGPDQILIQMIGRALTEPAGFIRDMHREFFFEISQRFLRELRRSCPDLTENELQLRYFLSVSTMLGTITDQVRLESMTTGKPGADNPDRVCDALTRYVVAGFQQAADDA